MWERSCRLDMLFLKAFKVVYAENHREVVVTFIHWIPTATRVHDIVSPRSETISQDKVKSQSRDQHHREHAETGKEASAEVSCRSLVT